MIHTTRLSSPLVCTRKLSSPVSAPPSSASPGDDDLAVARCPVCRWPLVQRFIHGVPVYVCGCRLRRTRRPENPVDEPHGDGYE